MAKQRAVPDKVKKDKDKDWLFKIEADQTQPNETDIDLDLIQQGNYEVEKLETETLPKEISEPDSDKKTRIRWFNNFSIKQNGNFIRRTYTVRIPNLRARLRERNSKLVIYSETNQPNLYYYQGTIRDDDTFDLTDGDPAAGAGP